ncbi:hypothetical protein PHYNN_258 [Pantoea phage Phynn]|nr:hypothetical protein PHYNN_258 [Pantoea phage Phynn]
MIIDYESKINDLVQNFQHPCDAEVPAGSYRRVIWQNHTDSYPAVNVGWDTEIIKIGTHLYTQPPFGVYSDPLTVLNQPAPPVEGQPPSTAILVPKIGYYFNSQSEIDTYISSIGATKIGGANNWYGADLTKQALFKHPNELAMYRVENSGGALKKSGPVADQRIRQVYDDKTGAFTAIDYYWNGDRIAYMKHDSSEEHRCMYTGMRVNTNADTSIPPVPTPAPVSMSALPSEQNFFSARSMAATGSISCIPATVGFAYTNIADAMLSAWNETRHTFKLYFDMLSGLPKGSGSMIDTMFDGLSIAMEEITSAAVALSQEAWKAAMVVFKNIMDSAFNIVGGAFDMIKNFLPVVSIMGVSISIYDLIFSDNSVGILKSAFTEIIKNGKAKAEEVIDSIYSFIGSSYKYAVEYVKAEARDIVDACTALYDWCITMFQNAAVALIDLYGRLMQLWSMPPIVPNPLWAAVYAIRNIMKQIKPLDIILSGNFPGFTAMDLYQQAQAQVKAFIDASYEKIRMYYDQAKAIYSELTAKKTERDAMKRKFEQYKAGMWEYVTEATTKAYQSAIDAANAAIDKVKAKYEAIQALISELKEGMKDTYSMAMNFLKNLPIMSTINEFLGYCGISLDALLQTYHNVAAGAESIYRNFVDSSRSFKDTCKIIYNQICTLALSKVTQYVNKLLSLIGLVINFPPISICVPVIKY